MTGVGVIPDVDGGSWSALIGVAKLVAEKSATSNLFVLDFENLDHVPARFKGAIPADAVEREAVQA
jgi:hypothetical protein